MKVSFEAVENGEREDPKTRREERQDVRERCERDLRNSP